MSHLKHHGSAGPAQGKILRRLHRGRHRWLPGRRGIRDVAGKSPGHEQSLERDGRCRSKQVLKCECKDKTALAMASEVGKVAMPFPRCPWAIDLSDKPFPGREKFQGPVGRGNPLDNLGGWFWESGFDQDPIANVERIRDLNLRAMYGAWDALKNVDKLYPNHRIGWAAFIAGKRESRRLLGDRGFRAEDFHSPIAPFPTAFPVFVAHRSARGRRWISKRARRARNSSRERLRARTTSIKGLTGRRIAAFTAETSPIFSWRVATSASRTKRLGPVRVMRTCGMMGEIVGKAAWICVSQETSPRGVYEKHLPLLKELMKQPGKNAPREARRSAGLTEPCGGNGGWATIGN